MTFQAIKVHDILHGDVAEPEIAILTDRLWPRGVAKANEYVQQWSWFKEVSPSPELRRWFQHDPQKFPEFAKRYCAELDEARGAEQIETLLYLGRDSQVGLLYAAHDRNCNHGIVLENWLTDHLETVRRNAVNEELMQKLKVCS